ncbi:MAG: hypothetical protein R3293_04275 [Candidatus Promineifilaceae bacterium]|nr:hypothetical protein [Candidatus Promineifilaceae bacterium]
MSENPEKVDPVANPAPPVESSAPVRKQKRSRKGNKTLTMSDVLSRFTSCGRCSMFLAAYRIEHSEQALKSAIANSDTDFLALPWDQSIHRLLIKSYGCRLDSDVYFFEGTCPECLGKFRYEEAEQDEPFYLLFKI